MRIQKAGAAGNAHAQPILDALWAGAVTKNAAPKSLLGKALPRLRNTGCGGSKISMRLVVVP